MIRQSIRAIAALAALGFAPGAFAQTPPPAPAATAPTIDPARLAVARQIVLKLFPPGTYREMLGDNYQQMMSQMMESMGGMPMAQIAHLGGLTEEQVKGLGDAKMGEVMDIIDPAWRERLKLLSGDMMGEMGGLFDKLEPRIREAMARAYARDFTLDQLNEILRFLETPTGTLYAKRSLAIFMDREVVAEMTAMMPEIMKEMPAIMEAIQKRVAELPPARKIEELSDEERQRLADLLGVDVADLNDPDLVPLP